MARRLDKEKAIKLRSKGKSYSEIKGLLGVSKGTLSSWLQDMPLTHEQMRNLRDLNPRRIESFRRTMLLKRQARQELVYAKVSREIGHLSERDLFLAGLYLYWGEGLKSAKGVVGVANTDPCMIKTFIAWLRLLGVPKVKIRVKLHLYADMNIAQELHYWSKHLEIPKEQFRKPYVKESLLAHVSYRNGFGHGTCNVLVGDMAFWEYITMALRHLREQSFRP